VIPELFLDDVRATPSTLRGLANSLDDGLVAAPDLDGRRVVFLGMGSSRYATSLPVAIARSRGLDVVAELASAEMGTAPGEGVLAVAISASGGSAETLAAAARHRADGSHVVALTEASNSELVDVAREARPLMAGPEVSQIACRSYAHTVAVLLSWTDTWTDATPRAAADCRRAADALEHLHATAGNWVPQVADALDGPHGVVSVAPAERFGTPLQGALMVRELVHRPADSGETGDWTHVDVYLTKSLDYRCLLHAGSAWDDKAVTLLRERQARFVTVGAGRGGTDYSGADAAVRYPHDDDPRVAAIVETVVLEMVSAHWWSQVGGAASQPDPAGAQPVSL